MTAHQRRWTLDLGHRQPENKDEISDHSLALQMPLAEKPTPDETASGMTPLGFAQIAY